MNTLTVEEVPGKTLPIYSDQESTSPALSNPSDPPFLKQMTSRDRRLLLTASLDLLIRRLRHNYPVPRSDISRLVPLGDPGDERSVNR
jgi:hypothetical protein